MITQDPAKIASVASLEQENKTLLLLNQASRILTSTLEVKEVLKRLLQITAQMVGAETCSVWLQHPQQPAALICRAIYHPGNEIDLVGTTIPHDKGVVGWVFRTGQSTIVQNPQQDSRFFGQLDAQNDFTTQSLLAVPLHLRNKTIGVVEVVNKLAGRFSRKDLDLVETLAASAAVAVENAQMVERLQKQMHDLQAQNEELDAFDHTVAHDLQNPLSLVLGFADLLLQSGEELSPEERHNSLESIVQNAYQMRSIINELLTLSSVRKQDVVTEQLAMDEIVQAALSRLKYMIQEYDAEVTRPDGWPTAVGYAPWVEEVWENYLSNALKYGGRPPKIELGSHVLADGRIQFWVRDNGPGIPPEKQALLFTPFTRLNQIRVTGYGLGLSIVDRIMKKLGGTVGVESTPGKGSIFSFTLPAAAPPETPVKPSR